MTSGASDEPPIPHKMKCLWPSPRDQADSESSLGRSALELSGKSTQSNLMAASFEADSPQSVGSLAANRAVISFSAATFCALALKPETLSKRGSLNS